MKLNNFKTLFIFLAMIGFMSCGNDDDAVISTDDDGGMMPLPVDFSGTFVQEDQMGRPGINTVLSPDSTTENAFNVTIPSEQGAAFQPTFLQRAVDLHAAFGVEYETNILGLDAPTLTTILASDVLQVAPNNPTSYFDGTNILTGRTLTDDVIDISLILFFGGQNGDRFNGQDLDGDGTPDLPILVTDGVSAAGETPSSSFPYLEAPHN
ncbi:hypothetical protein ACFO3O_02290 [Dokdonia ponticola]|uniref:DUF4331 domain-containing protein n=1 Tax=Dokdonia ponticola TaxID=2041041 RepID=A0ABV9HTX7_9FLAO